MIVPIFLIVLLITVLLHEGLHFLVALGLGYRPSVKKSVFCPAICYENRQNPYHNFWIACSAPLTLFIIGMLFGGNDMASVLFKWLCLANVFNLLPITNDGEMIFLSLCQMLRRR